MLTTEILTTRQALQAIAPEWRALWRACPGATPFQAPAWLLAWWDSYGDGSLFVLAFRHGAELAALCPLFLVRRHPDAPREALLIGTGNTDYLDVLALPGATEIVGDAVLRCLSECPGWDVCELRNLRPASPLLTVSAPRDWIDERYDETPCPVLTFAKGTNLEQMLPPPLAAEVQRSRRRAVREGGFAVEKANGATLDAHLSTLFDLHAARWRLREEPGVLADPATQRFHRATARAMWDAGCLLLVTVSIAGRQAAVVYAFVHAGHAYSYLGGFAPAWARLNPGKLALAEAMADALARGAADFDFLGGAEPYKYQWGAVDRPRLRRRLVRSGRSS